MKYVGVRVCEMCGSVGGVMCGRRVCEMCRMKVCEIV